MTPPGSIQDEEPLEAEPITHTRLKPSSDPPVTKAINASFAGVTDLAVIAAVVYMISNGMIADWLVPVCVVGLFAIAGISLRLRALGIKSSASLVLLLAAVNSPAWFKAVVLGIGSRGV